MRGPLDILKEEWEADKKSDESVLSHVSARKDGADDSSE